MNSYTVKRVEPSADSYLAELESSSEHRSDFFRAMANKPEVLKGFVPLYRAIMGAGSVDRRLKELVYIAVSYVNECPYCLAAHTEAAAKSGVSHEEIRTVEVEHDHLFTPAERAALQYARELTRTCDVEDVRDDLYRHFNDAQMVELTSVIALANFTNRFNNGLGIKPEE